MEMEGNAKTLGSFVTESLLAGVWVAIGFNPFIRISEVTIMGTAQATDYAASQQAVLAPSEYIAVIHLLVAIATLTSIVGAWVKGGTVGLVAMGCAFLGGALVFGAFELGSALIVMAYMFALVGSVVHDGGGSPPL